MMLDTQSGRMKILRDSRNPVRSGSQIEHLYSLNVYIYFLFLLHASRLHINQLVLYFSLGETVFGRPFVKWFALCRTVVLFVCLSCLSVLSVCPVCL